jgi:hypothetical protein
VRIGTSAPSGVWRVCRTEERNLGVGMSGYGVKVTKRREAPRLRGAGADALAARARNAVQRFIPRGLARDTG